MKVGQLRKADKTVRAAAAELNCEPEALPSIIEKFQHEIDAAKKELKTLK